MSWAARSLIATTWRGPRTIRPLQSPEDQAATCAALTDGQVEASLRKLDGWGWLAGGVPATSGARLSRLSAWPSYDDCDAIADLMTAYFDGVRPTVRVVERGRLRPPVAA